MKKVAITTSVFTLTGVFVSLGGAQAQWYTGPAPNQRQIDQVPLSMREQRFMTEAAQGNLAEIRLGQLASERGSTPAVRDYGKMLVTQHSKANDRLKTIASYKAFRLPGDLSADQQATYNRLSSLSGTEFDSAFLSEALVDHRRDAAAYANATVMCQNEELCMYAKSTLGYIRGHKKEAMKLGGKLPDYLRYETAMEKMDEEIQKRQDEDR